MKFSYFVAGSAIPFPAPFKNSSNRAETGSGAYGGLTFNGSVIKEDKDEDATPATGPEAEALRHNLASVW